MVLAWIGFRAQPHKRAEILSAVDEVVREMRANSACAAGRLLVDHEDPNTFIIESEWRSTEDVDSYFDSREFQIFKGIRMLLRGEPFVMVDDVRARTTAVVS